MKKAAIARTPVSAGIRAPGESARTVAPGGASRGASSRGAGGEPLKDRDPTLSGGVGPRSRRDGGADVAGAQPRDARARGRSSAASVDIGLPGLDGYGVARHLRQSLGGGVLLVALTGDGLPEDRRRALEGGFDAHLTKPVTLRAILRVLAEAHVPH